MYSHFRRRSDGAASGSVVSRRRAARSCSFVCLVCSRVGVVGVVSYYFLSCRRHTWITPSPRRVLHLDFLLEPRHPCHALLQVGLGARGEHGAAGAQGQAVVGHHVVQDIVHLFCACCVVGVRKEGGGADCVCPCLGA